MLTNKFPHDLDENTNYCIDETDQMSFEHFENMSNSVIEIYKPYNTKIINYLEKYLKMKIEWIACDYVKD